MSTDTADRPEAPHYAMYIGGEWVDTDERYEIRSPATERLIATVARGDLSFADRAVAAAKAAHEDGGWRSTPPAQRAQLLRTVADRFAERTYELAALHAEEIGATLRVAEPFHFGAALPHMHYLADLTARYEFESGGPTVHPVLAAGKIRREPIGVCAAIVPWNIPLPLSVWKVFPALGAGNTVVLKPDEHAPLILLELAREFEAAGLPAGVFNVVTGEGEIVGARLADHPDVRKIGFTGSTAVGKEIMRRAASNVKRLTLELGGKGANIVLPDANLEEAVDGSLFAFLMHSGQGCESGTRLLLPDTLHDEFVARMIERIKTLRFGDPMDYDTDLGPVFSAAQRDRILDYIRIGQQEGATLAYGGGIPTGPGLDKGFWVEPTIFTDVTNDMRIAREEIFGPVVSVIRYRSIPEAVAIANDSDYGLSAGVWSADPALAFEVAEQLEAGMVWINDWHLAPPEYPFGGVKQSGLGREAGPNALDEYTEPKFVSFDLSGGLDGKPYGLLLSTPAS
ncbi:aldehyde dehydrogenase family protein [Nocardia sp. NPDC005825]|uniref:aldehyde dehydrogenase family protein n=1 Tax=unclassified Nocardia TaxID=2637762 RepID=UPI0033CC31B2